MDDKTRFDDVRQHATELKARYAERNNQFEEYERAYLMSWKEELRAKLAKEYMRITTSPDARNVVLNSARLMIAGDPQFKITAPDDVTYNTDDLEQSVNRWWVQSGRIKRRPIHFDSILSAVLYGEMHTPITPIKDLAKKADGKHKKRIERAYGISPILIESWNPKSGYSEMDRFGLSAYLREVETTRGQLESDFGALLPEELKGGSRYGKVTLSTFYDLDTYCIWADGKLILIDDNPFPEIPVSVSLVDGSMLFDKPEDQRQPILYTFIKAGLLDHQSLMLTILYSIVFALGTNPIFKHTVPQGSDKQLMTDYSIPGGVIRLESGEGFDPMLNKGLIDPAFREAYQLAVKLGQESTMYPQAFGQPVERSGTTFSELALLNQSGRLPLIGPQRLGGEGIAHVVELGLMILKNDGEIFEKNGIKLRPADIPDNLEIECKLEVKLPQDKLQQANIATMLAKAGLADNEWVQENILNIQDTRKMQKRIWTQNASDAMVQAFVQTELAKMFASPQTPPSEEMLPEGTPPPGRTPETMTPKQMAVPMMPPGQAKEIQGLPPQMAGMLPGEGQGIMPGGE